MRSRLNPNFFFIFIRLSFSLFHLKKLWNDDGFLFFIICKSPTKILKSTNLMYFLNEIKKYFQLLPNNLHFGLYYLLIDTVIVIFGWKQTEQLLESPFKMCVWIKSTWSERRGGGEHCLNSWSKRYHDSIGTGSTIHVVEE